MPNTREKLIELVGQVQDDGCDYTECFSQWDRPNHIDNSVLVDHLIANGVKIPVPCEHCKRHTKCLIEEQLHFVKAEIGIAVQEKGKTMKCNDCLHYDVCVKFGRTVDFDVDDGVCLEFATDNNVGHKWISVKDRLPENRDDVLLCRKWWNEIRNPQMGWYNDVSRSWFDLSNREIHNVTHWMPLPQPPKGE